MYFKAWGAYRGTEATGPDAASYTCRDGAAARASETAWPTTIRTMNATAGI